MILRSWAVSKKLVVVFLLTLLSALIESSLRENQYLLEGRIVFAPQAREALNWYEFHRSANVSEREFTLSEGVLAKLILTDDSNFKFSIHSRTSLETHVGYEPILRDAIASTVGEALLNRRLLFKEMCASPNVDAYALFCSRRSVTGLLELDPMKIAQFASTVTDSSMRIISKKPVRIPRDFSSTFLLFLMLLLMLAFIHPIKGHSGVDD